MYGKGKGDVRVGRYPFFSEFIHIERLVFSAARAGLQLCPVLCIRTQAGILSNQRLLSYLKATSNQVIK